MLLSGMSGDSLVAQGVCILELSVTKVETILYSNSAKNLGSFRVLAANSHLLSARLSTRFQYVVT
jgi:hypothetical protein